MEQQSDDNEEKYEQGLVNTTTTTTGSGGSDIIKVVGGAGGNNNNNNNNNNGQKSRKSHIPPDPLESNKHFLFNLLQSDRLAWYYNKSHKNWEIVYLLEKSEQNGNIYIILTSHNQYLTVNKDELYHTPPTHILTAHESIQKLIHALLLKFQETALYKNKHVVCEYQSVSFFGYTTCRFEWSKIDDYHIQNNAIDGVWVSPLGENSNKDMPYKKLQSQKNILAFIDERTNEEMAFDLPIRRQNVELQKRQWYRELNRLKWENRALQEKLVDPKKLELERLRINALQKPNLEDLIRDSDMRLAAQEAELQKFRNSTEQLTKQVQLLQQEMADLKNKSKSDENNINITITPTQPPTLSTVVTNVTNISGPVRHPKTMDTPTIRETSEVGVPLHQIPEADDSEDEKSSAHSKQSKAEPKNETKNDDETRNKTWLATLQRKLLRSESDRVILEDSIGRYETDIGEMRMTILRQQEELEYARQREMMSHHREAQAHQHAHKVSMSMDESQAAYTRAIVQVSRLKEEMTGIKQKNNELQRRLSQYELPEEIDELAPDDEEEEEKEEKEEEEEEEEKKEENHQEKQNEQKEEEEPPKKNMNEPTDLKTHLRSMTRQQIEEEIHRYMQDNKELSQELEAYQADMQWYRVQLADNTQNLLETERNLTETKQEAQTLRKMSMQVSEGMAQILAVDSENVELKKTIEELERKLNLQGRADPKEQMEKDEDDPIHVQKLQEENDAMQEQLEFQSKEIEKIEELQTENTILKQRLSALDTQSKSMIPEDVEIDTTQNDHDDKPLGKRHVADRFSKMSRHDLEQDLLELEVQVETYEADLSNLRVELADRTQSLENETKEKAKEVAKMESLAMVADTTIDKYAITQKENERLRQQIEILKKNQAPDIRKVSELELELTEKSASLQAITQERDEVKRRMDTMWYEFKTLQDLYCLDQLQSHLQVDASATPFPTQETIISMYHSLVKKPHSSLHQKLGDKLELKYPNKNNDINHELYIDYLRYEFLYNIMTQCYKKMKHRQELFVKATAELLQMSSQAASVMISAGMQRSWKAYIKHTYDRSGMEESESELHKETTHLIESQFSRTTIDDIILHITDSAIANYGDWNFLADSPIRNALEIFIAKCCEVCWLMILLKPTSLTLYPPGPDINALKEPIAIEKESLNKTLSFVYGSIDTSSNVLYYAIPAVIVEGTNEVLYPAAAFTHTDEELSKAFSGYMKNEHKKFSNDHEDIKGDVSDRIQTKTDEISNSELLEKYHILQKENERLREQITAYKNDHTADVNKISILENDLNESQREQDALTRRVDSLLYELKTVQDLYCLGQLQVNDTKDTDSTFPTQETIVVNYRSFINDYHSKLHQEFREKLEVKYPNTNNDINYELFIDYVGYEFLYHVMIGCYKKIKERKEAFIKATAELLQTSSQAASALISNTMQRSWNLYIKHSYGNSGNDTDEKELPVANKEVNTNIIESQFSRTSIDDIITQISTIAIANYADWLFLTEPSIRNDLEVFIANCCEVCWLMVLSNPTALTLYPSNPDINSMNEPASIEKESLNKTLSFVYGSIDTCDNVLYYAIPAVIIEGTNEVLYPATAFTHKDEGVFNAISTYMKNEHKTAKNSQEFTTEEMQKSTSDGSNDEWTDVGNGGPESETEIIDNRNETVDGP